MSHGPSGVDASSAALFVDMYELTMVQAYWAEGMHDTAVFSLYVRDLPPTRNYLLAAGLEDVLAYLEGLRFDAESLAFLRGREGFQEDFLAWLGALRFTGDVWALPEGTPFFGDEPILEIEAPLPVAQLAETFVMNQVHVQTVLASKASRMVAAARGRAVVDFGARRMHGTDAGLKAGRAYAIAGLDATSNVLAGRVYGIPVTGTMAHSYVQAHDDELEAFRAFARLYPQTVLLVDTYDTLEGVRNVVRLAGELGDAFAVRAIRLDSGDLAELARAARQTLDDAGLADVEIFASGGLDEEAIARLVETGAPIDGFGVGTKLGVSADAPSLDLAYKLVHYAGAGRMKLSSGKAILPGPKQVFRREDGGRAMGDVIGRRDEAPLGRPLLRPVMAAGERLPAGREPLEGAARRAREELARLPERVRGVARADPPYPVERSAALEARRERVRGRLEQREGGGG